MKLQRVLLALCLSLAISSGLTLALGRHLREHPAKNPELAYVASARTVEVGEVLKPEDLKLIAWPKDHPLSGAFLKASEVAGRTALAHLDQGEPLLAKDLSVVGAGVGLAARIPGGMRAIALHSDDIVGVGGFINPGSHVDVLVTYRIGNAPEPSTLTALQDAEVIATGQRAQPDPSGKPESATVVTLLLTPENAERAVLASTQGTVHFVLRNSTDRSTTNTAPMQLSSLSGQVLPQTPVSPSRRPHPARQVQASVNPEIETILDGSVEPTSTAARGTK